MRVETGLFSRALSSGGVPLFLTSAMGASGGAADGTLPSSALGTSHDSQDADVKTKEGKERTGGRPEAEGVFAEKVSNAASGSTSTGKDEAGMTAMFKRSTSAPAAPAFLLRRMPSSAQAPPVEVHEDGSIHNARTASTERDGEAVPTQKRIAPSRASAEEETRNAATPAAAQEAALTAGKSVVRGEDKTFGRTGSLSRFRRAASHVLRVASAGKEREGDGSGDTLSTDKKEAGFFGFRFVEWHNER